MAKATSTTPSKKAAKQTVKTPKTPQRGNTYVLTADGKKHLVDVSGQGALIRDCVAKHGPVTAAQIVERIGKNLKTESPSKNIAFYLCVWKADGFVKFGPAPKK